MEIAFRPSCVASHGLRGAVGLACLVGCLSVGDKIFAAEPAEGEASVEADSLIDSATDRAIERGLKRLVSGQHDDGSFGSGHLRGNVAVTSLGAMAMLASGSTPGRGPYGTRIDRAIDYLLDRAQPSGFIVDAPSSSHGPMYGHGFSTLFLAECLGMSGRDDLRDALQRAVRLILECQNDEGGWRYQPIRGEADISVTTCQVMALRAAQHAGIDVPKGAVDRAVGYIKRCQNPDGGFMYSPEGGEPSRFPRSAAAISALYCAGIYEGPEIDRGLAYLETFRPKRPGEGKPMSQYFYGQYYAAGVFWQTGGKRAVHWYRAVRDDLLARQNADGSWNSPYTDAYATAMGCIVLQVPGGLLPIFQR